MDAPIPISMDQVQTIAKKVAWPIHRKTKVDLDDLTQVGMIGIVRAAPHFDSTKASFSTYAFAKARFAMLDYLRELDWVPRLERIKQKAGLAKEIPQVLSIHNKNRLDKEMLEDLTVKPGPDLEVEVELVLKKCGNTRLTQVLRLYYLEDLTMRDVGLVMGVSESRASQMHTEAIQRIREAWRS